MTLPEAARQAYLDQVRAIIAEHGWAIQAVEGPFAYTVGLTPHQHPELLVHGLPPGRAAEVLNYLARRVVHDGDRLDPEQLVLFPLSDDPANLADLTLGFAPEPTTNLAVARALYGHQVQCLRVRPQRTR